MSPFLKTFFSAQWSWSPPKSQVGELYYKFFSAQLSSHSKPAATGWYQFIGLISTFSSVTWWSGSRDGKSPPGNSEAMLLYMAENVPMLHVNEWGLAYYMVHTNVLLDLCSPRSLQCQVGMSGAFLRCIRSAVVRHGASQSTSVSSPELRFTGPLSRVHKESDIQHEEEKKWNIQHS